MIQRLRMLLVLTFTFALVSIGSQLVHGSRIRSLKRAKTIDWSADAITSISYSTDDGRFVATCEDRQRVDIVEVKRGESVRHCNHALVHCACFSPDGKWVAFSGNDLSIWSPEKRLVRILWDDGVYGQREFDMVKFSQDGSFVVAAGVGVKAGKKIYVWKVKTGKLHAVFGGHSQWITSISISPDGRYCVSADKYATILIWDIRSGKQVHQLRRGGNLPRSEQGGTKARSLLDESIRCVRFSPDGKSIAAIHYRRSKMNRILMWKRDGKEIAKWTDTATIVAPDSRILDPVVEFSPDGKLLAACEYNGRGVLFDVNTGRAVAAFDQLNTDTELFGRMAHLTCVSFSPSGKHMAVGDRDGRIVIWAVPGDLIGPTGSNSTKRDKIR